MKKFPHENEQIHGQSDHGGVEANHREVIYRWT
jgi:hypothetical protein